MIISIIVAMGSNRVIGKDNKLLWHLSEDLKMFKKITMGHHMIMGRKTFESIGKPLPGRTTIIITRDRSYTQEGCHICHSLEDAITLAKDANEIELVICGGGEIYAQALKLADKIYLTRVDYDQEGDTYFPEIDMTNWQVQEQENHEGWSFEIFISVLKG